MILEIIIKLEEIVIILEDYDDFYIYILNLLYNLNLYFMISHF